MGRPPSNGGPSFRFNQSEIAEMEAILQAHKIAMPAREVLVSLAEKFSNSEERSGKIEVQMKQVWNWFQNRRYAIRAKAGKSPGKLNVTQMTRDDPTMVKGVPQPTPPHAASSVTVRSLPQTQHPTVPSAAVRTFPQAPQLPVAFSVQSAGRVTDNSQMEYEAKSARDGAWYDVSTFLSHRSIETGDPEVLVRFAGFGAEEDEWVNVRKNVRQRSLPCESSECVAVLPADLILCFQEGKEQALYFDAHVLDAQRRRHDVRGCRCRFLVRYDHDQSEEIVALRKICRRPETDYRLQQLHAVNESLSANHNKNGGNNIHTVSTLRVYPPAEVQPKQHKVEPVVVVPPLLPPAEAPQKRQKVDSTVPEPLPEESQRQLKVGEEPTVLAAPPGDVPRVQQEVQPDEHKVEPMLPDTSAQQPSVESQKMDVSSAQDSAEAKYVETPAPVPPTGSDEVQLELQKVQPVVPDPSTEMSLEPKMVPVLSVQESAESQNVETLAPPPPTGSDEVQHELQKLQPVMPDLLAEESVEPKMVPVPSVQDSAELQNVETLEPPPPTGSHEVQLELQRVQPVVTDTSAEVSLEPKMVPVPSVRDSAESQNVETLAPPPPIGSDEVQLELQKVQPVMPDLLTEASVEQKVVPVPSVQDSAESQNVETLALPPPTGSDELQLELQNVQPVVVHDPLTEVSLEPKMVAISPVQDSAESQNVKTLAPPPPTGSDEVQLKLHNVQPLVPDSSTEVSLEPKMVPVSSVQSAVLQNIETLAPTGSDEVQLELQKVQPVVPDPSTEVSLEPKMVSVSSVQDSAESQNVETLAPPPPTGSDEVQLELHKIQPVMQDLSTEASVELSPSGEVSHEPQAAPSAETRGEPNEVAEPPPQKEPMMSSSLVEAQAELPEVQPANALEGEEPLVADVTNDSDVIEEAIEMETEEPVLLVPTNDSNVINAIEAEIEQPEVAEIMDIDDGNANKDMHANVAENASNGEAGNSELQSGNDNVTGDMEEV